MCIRDSVNPDVKQTFVKRSAILPELRSYLDGKGFLEGETPILTPFEIGAAARPFLTHHNTLDMDMVLRLSLIHISDLHGKKPRVVQQTGRDRQHQTLVRIEQRRLEDGPQLSVSYTHLDVYKRQALLPGIL